MDGQKKTQKMINKSLLCIKQKVLPMYRAFFGIYNKNVSALSGSNYHFHQKKELYEETALISGIQKN